MHQGALAGCGQIKVGQLDHQRIGRVGRSRSRQLIDQGRDAARAQGGVGRDLQLADLDVLAKNLGRQRQGQIKAPHGLDDRLAIDPGQAQAGRIGERIFSGDRLVHLAVGVKHQRSTFDAHLQWTDLEIQVHIVGSHAGLERHARAFAGLGVVVLNAQLDCLPGLLGQTQTQPQLQIGTQSQGHRAIARGIEELAQAVGQAQAGHIGQALQVEVQSKLVGIGQLEVHIEQQLAAGVVDAQVKQIFGQAQGLLDGQFGIVQSSDRVVQHRIELAHPGITQHHQFRQRGIDHRQLRGVEGLISGQLVYGLQAKAHGLNDVAKAEVAHIQQAAQIGQHHHDRTRRHRTVGQRLRQVKGRIAHLDSAPVKQVRHIQGQLQVLVKLNARTAGADAQTFQAGRGTAGQVNGDAAQGFARQQLGDFKAGSTDLVGCAIQRQRGLGLQSHA